VTETNDATSAARERIWERELMSLRAAQHLSIFDLDISQQTQKSKSTKPHFAQLLFLASKKSLKSS
jgi:hypothetical protein